jgi:hypothetical protein
MFGKYDSSAETLQIIYNLFPKPDFDLISNSNIALGSFGRDALKGQPIIFFQMSVFIYISCPPAFLSASY